MRPKKLIALTRYLPEYLKQVIDPVINLNGYFVHPEIVLLAVVERSTQIFATTSGEPYYSSSKKMVTTPKKIYGYGNT
jgi:hypothetical protein